MDFHMLHWFPCISWNSLNFIKCQNLPCSHPISYLYALFFMVRIWKFRPQWATMSIASYWVSVYCVWIYIANNGQQRRKTGFTLVIVCTLYLFKNTSYRNWKLLKTQKESGCWARKILLISWRHSYSYVTIRIITEWGISVQMRIAKK